MRIHSHYSLQSHNTFAIDASCAQLIIVDCIEDLNSLPELISDQITILGEGSNVLFAEDYAGQIIQSKLQGIIHHEDDSYHYLEVASGENWHQLVQYCLHQGIYGLENLALIPGSVGAAPVQNIGAYGVEFSSVCDFVQWYDIKNQEVKRLSNLQCKFAYRNSIFKTELANQAIIINVGFKIPKAWTANKNYQGLSELPNNCSAQDIFNQVVGIRQQKLPDPKLLPNAGSFFKNPIVSQQQLIELQHNYHDLPFYPQLDGTTKIAAGWLIDKAALKGFCIGGAAVHQNQALVIVNQHRATGRDIIDLAKYIQQKIQQQFNITLEPEVRLLGANGLQDLSEF